MKARQLAATLMLISGVTHPSQLLIYGTEDPNLVNASLAGMSFLLVGAALLSGRRWSLWLGAMVPLLFGLGSVGRILTQEVTPFAYPHTLVDFVVAGICIVLLRRPAESA